MPSSFRDLRVWEKALKSATEIYRATAQFPKHELDGLSQQLRRAAVSIPSNIAEGKGHRSDREFTNFLLHARGSLLEVHTQMMIARDLQYIGSEQAEQVLASADAIGRGLNALINSLRERPTQPRTTND